MKAVILPGFDGTGLLLETFLKALHPAIEADIIRYPVERPLEYAALTEFIRPRLPDEPYILIGESFSGPLALRIAAAKPANLHGVIVVASFARLDYPTKHVLRWTMSFMSPRVAPLWLIGRLLMGANMTKARLAALQAAVRAVASKVLSARAKAVLSEDLLTGGIRVHLPTLYLRATRDRIMPKAAAATVQAVAPDTSVITIDGPHFLLQTRPEECANAIKAFAASL